MPVLTTDQCQILRSVSNKAQKRIDKIVKKNYELSMPVLNKIGIAPGCKRLIEKHSHINITHMYDQKNHDKSIKKIKKHLQNLASNIYSHQNKEQNTKFINQMLTDPIYLKYQLQQSKKRIHKIAIQNTNTSTCSNQTSTTNITDVLSYVIQDLTLQDCAKIRHVSKKSNEIVNNTLLEKYQLPSSLLIALNINPECLQVIKKYSGIDFSCMYDAKNHNNSIKKIKNFLHDLIICNRFLQSEQHENKAEYLDSMLNNPEFLKTQLEQGKNYLQKIPDNIVHPFGNLLYFTTLQQKNPEYLLVFKDIFSSYATDKQVIEEHFLSKLNPTS